MYRSLATIIVVIAWLVTAPLVGASPPVPAAKPAFALAKHYAPMFEKGRVWKFDVLHNLEWGGNEGEGVKSTSRHMATCKVTIIRRWPNAIGSRITCDGALAPGDVISKVPFAGTFLAGDWVASEKGLWRFGYPALDGSNPDLDPATMLIASHPKPMKQKSESDFSGESVRVRRVKSTWCVTNASWGGDQSGETYCFADNGGLRAGGRYFLGGSFDEVVFCVAPMLCEMVKQ